jgi:hypothetical protein
MLRPQPARAEPPPRHGITSRRAGADIGADVKQSARKPRRGYVRPGFPAGGSPVEVFWFQQDFEVPATRQPCE